MKRLFICLIVVCMGIGLTACVKKEETKFETPIENNQETSVIENIEEPAGASVSQYSLFATTIAGLAENVMSDATEAKVQAMIKGSSITDAQIYNLIARKIDIEDEANLLPSEEAENAITQFEGEEGTITVITADNHENIASCYVTGKGNVFCWPPMVYQEKSYVNSKTTVKDESGNDITDLTSSTYIIDFGGLGMEKTETVQITTNAEGAYEMVVQ